MKTLLALSGLLSMTLGVTAQLPPVTTTTWSGISFYAPSLTKNQQAVQRRQVKFRALLSTNTPIRIRIAPPQLHSVPWQEPHRDLHLIDLRIQPLTPENTK